MAKWIPPWLTKKKGDHKEPDADEKGGKSDKDADDKKGKKLSKKAQMKKNFGK